MSRRRARASGDGGTAFPAGRAAFAFVVAIGIVNLFGDVTYEGGASLNGQFLGSLGASAAMVAMLAGAGEFLGYALRPLSGWAADRTGRYWLLTFVGYVINLFAMPTMALAGSWRVAGALLVTERVGRAIRKPTVDAMLSYSTGKHGRGWVYALATALDETGALVGPIVVSVALFTGASYRTGYALLGISAVAAFGALVAARWLFPVPARLEAGGPATARAKRFGRAYLLYTVAGALFAAGLMSFELIAFHLSSTGTVPIKWLPLFLALATATGIPANLALGRLYDRHGIAIVGWSVAIAALFSPFVFLGNLATATVGLLLWGIGYAVQDTLLKALIAGVLPEGRRNLAFGLFYLGYGVGWLAGGIATGLLYEASRIGLVVFAGTVQLASIPVFVAGGRAARRELAAR